MRRPIAALAIALPALFVAASAHADIAAPDGFVETCTVQQQCPGAGTTCAVTQGQVDTTCDAAAKNQGLVEKCTSFGATNSEAVYCPPSTTTGDAATTTTNGAGSTGGCSFGDASPSWLIATVAALGLGVIVRRRRGK